MGWDAFVPGAARGRRRSLERDHARGPRHHARLTLWKQLRLPGADGISALAKLAAAALEEGACGISLGLGYAPGIFSEMRELEGMARCAQRYGRLLTVHLKALSRLSGAYPLKLFDSEPHNLKALREMLDLAERTGVKMQISHLIFVGKKTWPTVDRALEMIDQAVARGADIAFDSFPYLCGNTTIFVVYPTWFLQDIERNFRSTRARFRLKLEVELITRLLGFGLEDIQVLWGGHPEAEQYNGMFFGDIARAMGCPVLEAYLKISELSRGKTLCLLHKYSGNESDESAYRKVLAHPLNLVETDTILTRRGRQNPAGFGTFPASFSATTRNWGCSLRRGHRQNDRPLGAPLRAEGARQHHPGCWADLTVFDYAAIKDNTSFQQLEARPSGIRHVFVNGTEVVRDGRMLPVRPAGRCCVLKSRLNQRPLINKSLRGGHTIEKAILKRRFTWTIQHLQIMVLRIGRSHTGPLQQPAQTTPFWTAICRSTWPLWGAGSPASPPPTF